METSDLTDEYARATQQKSPAPRLSAAEFKDLLLERLASGNDLRRDLEHPGEIDITVMQLLWAAGREADRTGTRIAIRVSDAAGLAAREAGFVRSPR